MPQPKTRVCHTGVIPVAFTASDGGGRPEGNRLTDFHLLNQWIVSLRNRNYSKSTLSSYRQTGTQFIIWCHDNDLELGSITHTEVQAWLDSRSLGPRAKYHYTSRLASFYGWLVREELILRDPTLRVDRPRLGRYLPRPADPEQVQATMLAADPRTVAMIALGAFAGMRRGEIAKLRAEDLLLRTDPPSILVHGKGGKERLVPMHATVLFALKRAGIPKAGFMFLGQSGRPLNPGRIGALITDALGELGEHTTTHQLRHLFATLCYADGHDIRLVQELLGHSSVATTSVYTAYSNEDAQRVVGRLQMGSQRRDEQQAV